MNNSNNTNMESVEETPLGWAVNMLYYFAHCATILAEDIDQQLSLPTKGGQHFIREKKKAFHEYEEAIQKAQQWLQRADEKMQVFDPDGVTFEAVNNHSGRYDNAIAYSNDIIRFNMLFMDRAQVGDGDLKIYKFLRSLPKGNAFPDEYIERFRMKLKVVPEVGDRIKSDVHGTGVLEFNTCGKNWAVLLDTGDQIILNESQFTLL